MPPHPQQNSLVERKQRHLLDVVRCLMFQSNLPQKYWGESILTATYLINRTPSPTISYQPPYEKLFNHIANYSHLKVFGCLCCAKDNSHKTKFQPRAIKGSFRDMQQRVKFTKSFTFKPKKSSLIGMLPFIKHSFPTNQRALPQPLVPFNWSLAPLLRMTLQVRWPIPPHNITSQKAHLVIPLLHHLTSTILETNSPVHISPPPSDNSTPNFSSPSGIQNNPFRLQLSSLP